MVDSDTIRRVIEIHQCDNPYNYDCLAYYFNLLTGKFRDEDDDDLSISLSGERGIVEDTIPGIAKYLLEEAYGGVFTVEVFYLYDYADLTMDKEQLYLVHWTPCEDDPSGIRLLLAKGKHRFYTFFDPPVDDDYLIEFLARKVSVIVDEVKKNMNSKLLTRMLNLLWGCE